MKLGKFKVISQGLALPLSAFDVEIPNEVGVDVTDLLGITYSVAEDNVRKANKVDKYQRMAQRMGKKFSKNPYKWLMRRHWGKIILFSIYGRTGDKSHSWPSHICSKTDVERIQNMPWMLGDGKAYVATEKIDGSSCTFAAERGRFGKIDYYVCSRNVVFKNEMQDCFYDSNIYYEMFNQYGIKDVLAAMLEDMELNNVAIQGECYGDGVQKRNYSLTNGEHQFAVFHIVTNKEKYPMEKVAEICEKYGLPHVPVLNTEYYFPKDIEELQKYVENAPSMIDGKPREGIVFYNKETGQIYTKFVSPEFLLKYH